MDERSAGKGRRRRLRPMPDRLLSLAKHRDSCSRLRSPAAEPFAGAAAGHPSSEVSHRLRRSGR